MRIYQAVGARGRCVMPARRLGGLLLTAGLAALLAAPALAATLIDNVRGYTFDQLGRLQRFEALLVDDAGRVAATGSLTTMGDRATTAIRIDGGGATLLPGLIDAHGHVMGLGFQALEVNLADTTSLDDALARLKAYAEAHPDLPWIRGRGWNQARWGLERFPTAAELDAVIADRPVWLERVDGHAGWANSAALSKAGVKAATVDPAGGRIERDADGAPSGVLVDAAMDLVNKVVPAPTPEQRAAALTAALAELASVGLTSVHDAGIDAETWALYRKFGDEGRLTVRIGAMIGGMGRDFDVLARKGPVASLYDDRLSLRAVKLYADGALGSRGAALTEPYADDPPNKGLLFNTDARLANWMSRAIGAGFQVNVHAIGDAANAQVIDSFASILKYTGNGLRHRIEHAQVMTPADIERAANLGLIFSMQPTHATSDRVMAEARLDPERLAGAYAWRTALERGGRLAFGSDFPVEPANPFYGLHAAVTRQGHDGEPEGGWMPAQKLTVEEALRAFTLDAAYAGFQEGNVGSLVPGKWADFILVDQDIFKAPPETLWQAKVLQTWVAGTRVFMRESEQ